MNPKMTTISANIRDINKQNKHNFPVKFHEEFGKFFGKSPLEINQNQISPAQNGKKFDTDYIGKMTLNSSSRTLRHFSNMKTPLADDIAHQSDFIENMKEYFRDPTYSREAYIFHNKNFPELASYISAKFPKAQFPIDTTRERYEQIMH